MAELLSAVVNTASAQEREPLYRQINTLEETGDDITHKVYLGLDKVFFTPLNRKDIHILVSAIDDVADNIHEAAGRMNLYDIEIFIPAIAEMAGHIQLSCMEIQKLLNALDKIRDTEAMLASCRLIRDHEHQTDLIYYQALAELFAGEKDAITLIKHRDILYSLEASANKCKNVTDAIEIIILTRV
ncbi:MAG: hypothetical protein JWP78_58 [Mucilaginibacter sp.]|nr:hypothetical protein [Mucilaginibacter sp.]